MVVVIEKKSIDKILSSIKKNEEIKPHPKNPNYFGKNYKTQPKKVYPVNKLNEILKEPIKNIKEEDNRIKSIIKLEQQIIKIKTPVKVESNKFKKFIANIKSPEYRKFAIILPIILYRLSALIIANKSVYLGFLEVFKYNTNTLNLTNWENLSFISKIYTIIKDYMILIYKNGSLLGYAETIILINLILDEIPQILLTNQYNNINELPVIKLAKHLAQNTKTIVDIEQNQAKQDKNNEELKDNKIMLRQLIETNNEVTTNYNEILKKVETKIGKNDYMSKQEIAKIIVDDVKKESLKPLSKGEFVGKEYIQDLAKIMSGNKQQTGIGYTPEISKKDVIKAMEFNKPIHSSNKGYKMYFQVKKSNALSKKPKNYKRTSDSYILNKPILNKKKNSI